MIEQGFWNGLPTEVERGTAIVADAPEFPLYWAKIQGIVGQRIEVVRVVLDGVNYGGGTTYLDDRGGEGWSKVASGGSPRSAHADVAIEPGSFEPFKAGAIGLQRPAPRGDWMQTFTGEQFFPLEPRAEAIDPIDIAHALSLLCRYNGHVDRFYSVAEHCVLISQWLADEGHPPLVQLEGLLHDATEAYVGDMVRPLKINMPAYRDAEAGVQMEIWRRFNLPSITYSDGTVAFAKEEPIVKEADTRILLDERAALMSATRHPWTVDDLEPLGVAVTGWYPPAAEAMYLKRLAELSAAVAA